jgi:hypothetical protein
MGPGNIDENGTALGVPKGTAAQLAESEGISTACYENCLPPFVEAELERLYGSLFSSLPQFRAYGGLSGDTSTYVARRSNEIIAIFLFRRENRQVQVLNQGMQIDCTELRRFADYIFSTYQSVSVILFHAVQAETQALAFPVQRFNCTADIVLTLPDSPEEYLASLGKNMRRNIRRYMGRLKRSFPSFRYDFYVTVAVDEQQIREIIRINRERIAGKNKIFHIGAEEVEQIIALANERGLVGLASIDNQVCGGAIGYRIGENYFFKVIAHDPKYDDYSTGILCCYLTICECIVRGCREFNFMWDGYEYKFSLGAVKRNYDQIAIYRSQLDCLMNASVALRIAANGYIHLLKSWLLDQAGTKNNPGLTSRLAYHVVNSVRRLKKIRSVLPTPKKLGSKDR